MTERSDLERQLIEIDTELARRKKPPVGTAPEIGKTDFFKGKHEGVELYLVDAERRAKVRAGVQSLPPFWRILVETAPQVAATYVGSKFGLKGASLAGTGVEAISQNIGLSPMSDVGLGLAAGGPFAGRAFGATQKGAKKAFAGLTKAVVPVRVAIARNAMRHAVKEFESIGSRIIAKQKGFMGIDADRLFQFAEKSKIIIPAFRTTKTKEAIVSVLTEIKNRGKGKMLKTPEGKLLLGLVDDLQDIMSHGSVSFGDLVFIRQTLGPAIKRAGRAAGFKLGAEKLLFKGVFDDMAHLASLKGKTGKAGKIAQAAFARSKLMFAVEDLNTGIAGFVTPIKAMSARQLDIKGMRKWLDKVTNPNNKKAYMKNMTEALEDELPRIKQRLLELDEFSDASPAGPGGLVLRALLAKVGFDIGGATGGLMGEAGRKVGQVLGSFGAIRIPEIMTAIISSDAAVEYLKKAMTAGSGEINKRMWDTAGQIAAQGIKVEHQRTQARLDQPIGP